VGRGSRVAGRGAIVVTAVLLVACSGGRTTPTATLEATVAPTATSVLSSDLELTIENVVLACREKDSALLRTFLATAVPDEQVQALFALGRDVVLKGQTPAITGDQASVTVDLEVQRTTGSERVQRTWQLVRGADGLWRLTALPDCY
jgi:hypothetical protein